MSKLSPISSAELVKKLRKFGFSGPYQEGKHPYMIKNNISLTVPNPHEGDASVDLLTRILKQAGISRVEWLERQ
ncbi:MAG: type II toxin-antitoxin system HicA family toxin [Patescibacteria group bacterium]